MVIPCHDEPDPLLTVQSLAACSTPRCAVEVLVVMNASSTDPPAVHDCNARGIAALEAWRAVHDGGKFRLRVIDHPRLDPRHAGVGLARKLGMDAAVARFVAAGNPDGVIACLDADCRVDANYLAALEGHFAERPPSGACTVYFEHPLDEPLDAALRRAATHYELHLRYYRHGLRHARFPHDHYTVGSCLAVRCETYVRHGGMNRRRAGEDFYFLDKLMATRSVSELTATRVIPGVRISSRTPFGTGRALVKHLAGGAETWQTYAPEVFTDLTALVASVDDLGDPSNDVDDVIASLPAGVVEFLHREGFGARHREIRNNTASPWAYEKRFFRWLNAFRAMKLIHHLTRAHHPRRPLPEACVTLLSREGTGWEGARPPLTERELLECFRARDRGGMRLDSMGAGVRLLSA